MSSNNDTHTFSDKDGAFRRKPSTFRNFISSKPDAEFPAEKDRYALYIHIGCPWAHRANIMRTFKGLEDLIQLIVFDTSLVNEGKGWGMSGKPGFEEEPLYGFTNIKELYQKASPGYEGRCTVPMVWDKKTGTIVNNESSEVIRMFYTEFDALIPEPMREATKGSAGLYPPHLQSQIEEMNAWVYPELNNGVYRTGFATSQDAYDAAVATVFVALDKLEHHLAKSNTPYLFGDNITEADIRLYPTILRFDVAYHTIFKCNLKMIRYDYPKLHAWVRNLYWDESERTRGAFKNTVDFQAYKDGYTNAIKGKVVPIGPAVSILPL